MKLKKTVLTELLTFVLLLSSCNILRKATQPTAGISSVRFLGVYEIPYNLNFENTIVGGLSGIDYDAAHNLYYLISDDRSDKDPARFYTAHIHFSLLGIESVDFVSVKNMLQPNGTVYPDKRSDAKNTPDPEAIRYNPISGHLVWSSEGERIVKPQDTVLADPAVRVISTDGKYLDSFILPSNLQMHATENGPRQNGVLEGLSFADNYKTLFVCVEEPLYEDGASADLTDNNAFIRIYEFDAISKKNTAQYGYKLEPIPYAPIPVNAFKINGVPDILSIGNNKLLVIERSFSTGRLACSIKVFLADMNNAADISKMVLKDNTRFVPVSKKLLVDMDKLGMYTDNIEGVTFGPVLPNGHKTLLFIADNNFNAEQKSQLLLFEVEE